MYHQFSKWFNNTVLQNHRHDKSRKKWWKTVCFHIWLPSIEKTNLWSIEFYSWIELLSPGDFFKIVEIEFIWLKTLRVNQSKHLINSQQWASKGTWEMLSNHTIDILMKTKKSDISPEKMLPTARYVYLRNLM